VEVNYDLFSIYMMVNFIKKKLSIIICPVCDRYFVQCIIY
jgi:hypothetical protein